MQSLAGLIVRLERAGKPDRRLDAEVVAAACGPPGACVDPVEGLDGWDVLAPDAEGSLDVWREAADIPAVTAYLDAACDVAREALPEGTAQVIARALRHVKEPEPQTSSADLIGQAAREIMVELLRTLASERRTASQAA